MCQGQRVPEPSPGPGRPALGHVQFNRRLPADLVQEIDGLISEGWTLEVLLRVAVWRAKGVDFHRLEHELYQVPTGSGRLTDARERDRETDGGGTRARLSSGPKIP